MIFLRLLVSDKQTVLIRGLAYLAFVRRVSGGFTAYPFSSFDDEVLLLILPRAAVLAAGETVLVDGKPYLCLSSRLFPGSVQAQVRRQAAA